MPDSARKPLAILATLALLALWIIAVASLSGPIAALPRWLQPVIYIIAGVAWVFPLRPVFRWMNTPPQA
jgi:predicted membrane channel-forming protein YqfA (hemolysin III family)